MRKLFLISAAAVTLSALLLSYAISSDNNSVTHNEPTQTISQESRKVLYVMKSVDGKIGVFKPESQKPLYTLGDVHLKSLPQYDQKLLNTGIKVYSEKELKSLIEDYDS